MKWWIFIASNFSLNQNQTPVNLDLFYPMTFGGVNGQTPEKSDALQVNTENSWARSI